MMKELSIVACRGISQRKEKPFSTLYSIVAHQNPLLWRFCFCFLSMHISSARLLSLQNLSSSPLGFTSVPRPAETTWSEMADDISKHHNQASERTFQDRRFRTSVCRAGAVMLQLSLPRSWKHEPLLFKLKLKLCMIQNVQATRNYLRNWIQSKESLSGLSTSSILSLIHYIIFASVVLKIPDIYNYSSIITSPHLQFFPHCSYELSQLTSSKTLRL